MGFEDGAEQGSTSGGYAPQSSAFEEAIKQGEYQPEFLSKFPEWKKMSRHRQFQYIRQGINNRERQISTQWAEVNNVLNFSKKPHLQEALRNLEKQLQNLREDKEELFVEYSK